MALKLYIYLDLKGSILKTSKSIFSTGGLVPLDDIQPRWIDGDKCETREEWS